MLDSVAAMAFLRFRTACFLALATGWSGAATAIAIAAPNAPTSVVRWVDGSYQYRRLTDGGERGRETFRMSLHADGTRVMRATTDIFSRGVQVSVIQRVAPNFRPLDAHVTMYLAGGFKGAGTFVVVGDRLTAATRTAGGIATRQYSVPDSVSIGSHPLVLDGWHTWHVRPELGKVQAGTVFLIDGDPDLTKPMLGTARATKFEYLGENDVVVPAGRFRARHYRIDGRAEVWIATEDRILIRSVWPQYGSEYVLEQLDRSDRPKPENKQGD